MAPLCFFMIVRLLNPCDPNLLKSKDKKPKMTIGDWYFRIAIVPAVFFYIVDCILKILREDYLTTCGCSFLFHHIVSIAGLPFMWGYGQVDWYLMGPGTLHSFLMAFPHHKFLNYIYLASVICFHYGLYQQPYHSMWNTKYVKIGISLVEFSCILLWFFNCSNAMEPAPV